MMTEPPSWLTPDLAGAVTIIILVVLLIVIFLEELSYTRTIRRVDKRRFRWQLVWETLRWYRWSVVELERLTSDPFADTKRLRKLRRFVEHILVRLERRQYTYWLGTDSKGTQ